MAPTVFDDDFLLETETARELYHRFAADAPILDYHSHLPPAQVAQDHRFATLAELWLSGDHYKWRAMRANGVPERFCSGDASPREKFEAWARTVPDTIRNPLFHWTHLELKHPFGIKRRLDASSVGEIWEQANRLLRGEGFTAQGLLSRFRVKALCTTDDPADSLESHRAFADTEASRHMRMLPAWRCDAALKVEEPRPFNAWLDRLEDASKERIRTFDGLLKALEKRHTFFHEQGCRLADCGMETAPIASYTLSQIRASFKKARGGQRTAPAETARFRSALIYELSLLNHRRGWVQQFHLGALRNVNTRMRDAIGPDAGFDTLGDPEMARPLASFLDRLDRDDRLAKTILYNLNPRDNELFAAMAGCFQDGSTPGKVQYGPAWWFSDQLDGMERQLDALSSLGLLSRFIGMTTDSRSFLSFSRHEYFRRHLCNLLGNDVQRGRLPDDLPALGGLVRALCLGNARAYFGLPMPPEPSGPVL